MREHERPRDAGAHPVIIQGGMGVGVSGWRLARAVSRLGQLGVVSGTGTEALLIRRLQDGDPGGDVRRAIERFPLRAVAQDVLRRYFVPGGLPAGAPYALLPMYRQRVSKERQQFTMLSTFVEVHLAKEGHDGVVGMNLLAKIQLPTLPSLYGAMLAGVDFVLMGAGIPREIPGILDALAAHEPCALRLDVEHLPAGRVELLTFDPREHWDELPAPLGRPRFLAIIASNSLATMLARKSTGHVDGFVIERSTAGGHNAPPRGEPRWNERGEPLYGPRDEVDLAKLRELGLPFWLAGGTGRPGALAQARAAGAAGIQVGTLFAFCDESGITDELKRSVLACAKTDEIDVRTDPHVSPTGYPFKVVRWPEDPAAGVARERVCDLGYLRVAYLADDRTIGYRCPAEPVETYVAKGGRREDTEGRRCLCNALTATIGHGQRRDDGAVEPPLVTSGDDLLSIADFLGTRGRYGAVDVVAYLLSCEPERHTAASAARSCDQRSSSAPV